MLLCDSGFFIALLDPGDGLHRRARAWASQLVEELVVTEDVLWETINFGSKPPSRSKVHTLVAEVRSGSPYEFILASPELFDAGLPLHAQRPDKPWSLTDCISFVVMRRRGITRALAYDHHFEQAGFRGLAPSRSDSITSPWERGTTGPRP
jgi:predicted nucleic acid-binding protein